MNIGRGFYIYIDKVNLSEFNATVWNFNTIVYLLLRMMLPQLIKASCDMTSFNTHHSNFDKLLHIFHKFKMQSFLMPHCTVMRVPGVFYTNLPVKSRLWYETIHISLPAQQTCQGLMCTNIACLIFIQKAWIKEGMP